ncbi:transporter [Halobacterium yunchengense]|uniref:transporter n=1 Tax=Halobacterium yunchengense TaxID=3108497 RepID=UPI00300B2247
MSERATERFDAASVSGGVVTGVLAYAVGYVLTYLWQADAVRDSLEAYNAIVEFLGGDPVPAWTAVGWLYYNAHNVAVTHPALGGGRVSRNFIADGNAPVLLYLLPPLLLAVAGFAVARRAGAATASDGARAGGTVAAGYVLLAVVGLVAFRYSAGGATMHVDYALGVLLAGLLYPLGFGALGGALGAATAAS